MRTEVKLFGGSRLPLVRDDSCLKQPLDKRSPVHTECAVEILRWTMDSFCLRSSLEESPDSSRERIVDCSVCDILFQLTIPTTAVCCPQLGIYYPFDFRRAAKARPFGFLQRVVILCCGSNLKSFYYSAPLRDLDLSRPAGTE